MIASEITIIAEIFPRFTGRDVPISEIAKATGKSERFLKRVLREDIMHFGIADDYIENIFYLSLYYSQC